MKHILIAVSIILGIVSSGAYAHEEQTNSKKPAAEKLPGKKGLVPK